MSPARQALQASRNLTTVERNLTAVEMLRELLWFTLHTLIAVAFLLVVLFAVSLTHPDPAASKPKVVGTVLALFVPMLGGFLIARIYRHPKHSPPARYTWVSGLLFFCFVSVWVLDLPTGPGLCEHCGALEKLLRTFFTFDQGSGLIDGNGLLVGAWVPLAMVGYAIGAHLALDP